MEWVETTGRTVAEALDAALDQLGVDEQEAEVQVLQEPQKGLFGRLRAEARVRVRVRPTRPRPKAERRGDRRRREGGRERRNRGGGSTTANQTEQARGSGHSGNGSGGSKSAGANQDSERDQKSGQEGEGAGGNGRRRRRRRGSSGAKQQGAAVTNQTSDAAAEPAPAGPDLDAQREAVEEFLRGLADAFGRDDATVSVQVIEEDTLEAEVNGNELGLLVGPKGQTLQAVHELVRSMVQRRFVGQDHARVRVDVAGYRQRRREALERFTRTTAEQVVSTGKAAVLDPMGASDRKVVHDTANEIDGVVTASEGEEPARRVIIQPS